MASMPLIRLAKKSDNLSKRNTVPFERRLFVSLLYTGLPGILFSSLLLWISEYSLYHKIEGTAVVAGLWIGISLAVRNNVIHSIRVLSNVIAAVQEEDFSFRATQAVKGDALGDLALDINNLVRSLESERLGAVDSANLLRKVMNEADAVIFALTLDHKICLLNRAGAAFLQKREDQILNRTAEELGISDLFEGPPSETISRVSAGTERRWIVRRASFRQHGLSHRLILLSEASEALRAEERLAWQRIIRVLGHEINNSLAPIKSIARTLSRMSANVRLPAETEENFRLGLDVISNRADSLTRFLQSYARLGALPPPSRRMIDLTRLITGIIALESRWPVALLSSSPLNVFLDQAQFEQALINLISNAVEAVLSLSNSMPPDDAVTVSWKANNNDLELCIRDRGVGLLDTDNLFVPFYTTKETGSGIGLILSRQIIEAHQGQLVVRNRVDSIGCEVIIRIPACIMSIESKSASVE